MYEYVSGLTMWYDDTSWYPFIEDENGNISGPGHQDKKAFIETLWDYDKKAGQLDGLREDYYSEDDVSHLWILIDETKEKFDVVPQETPGSMPITAVWGVR